MSQTHLCPTCGERTKFSILAGDVPYLVLDGQVTALSDIAARLYCPCGWFLNGVLHDVVFDVESGNAVAGQFLPKR